MNGSQGYFPIKTLESAYAAMITEAWWAIGEIKQN